MHNQRTAHLFTSRTPRLLFFLAACLAAVFSPRVEALGLGNIEVQSYLGQPLQARIELLSRSPGELEGVSAQIGSADSFQLVGLDRMALSVPLRFMVHPDTPDAWIEVTSLDPVKDPVVQFVVEVNFANGRLLRQYTLFLDPPTVSAPAPMPSLSSRPAQEPAPAASSRPEPQAEPAKVIDEPAPAPVVREDAAVEKTLDPVPETKPEPAEIENLEQNPIEPEEAEAVPEATPAPSRAARYQVSQADLERYGPVRRGETLWSIASGAAQGTGFSVNQVMLAIQRYNPDAFDQDNINLLKSGAILRLPPPTEIDRMTAREAMLESMRQADDYAQIRAGRMPESRPAPVLSDAAVEEPDGSQDYLRSASATDEGHLELIPPADSNDIQAAVGASGDDDPAGESDAGDPAADTALLTEEEREAAALESEHLTERLQELQEELGETSAGIAIEDKGLADMEQRLREDRLAPPEPEADKGRFGSLWWLLLLPLVLGFGAALWWMRRRAAGADAGVPGSPADTARAMADEAAEILEALDRDPEEVIDELTPASSETTSEHTSGPQSAAPVIALEDYIGDIDRSPEEPEEPAGDAADEPVGHESEVSRPELPAEGEDDGTQEDDEAGDELPVEENDPETKLDLARAYISMGDADAARELLVEVLSDGNAEQVEEARSMMSEI